MSIEVMKQALEALVEVTGWTWTGPMRVMDEVEDAITALRTAIDEAEKQERNFCGRCGKRLGGEDHIHTCTPPMKREWVHATQWRGLTDEEIEECWDGYLSDYQLQMIREMEAKLKEKNT